MEWTQDGLAEAGFLGFVVFANLPVSDVPAEPGVYLVLRVESGSPRFRARSPAGVLKGKDPTVEPAVLEAAWVPGATVVYIGKAGGGTTGRRGLRTRLGEYRRHGAGAAAGHWGGRYIWQLIDSDRLLVAWKTTPAQDPKDVESELITDFVHTHGRLPFANRLSGRAP